MPSSADLLDLERRFWLEASADLYTDAMAAEGVMVFAPVGILDKEQTIAAVEGAGAWSEVDIDDVRTIELTPGSAALVYRVHGVREGQAPYDALATSVYIHRDGAWQIAVHQQTPLD